MKKSSKRFVLSDQTKNLYGFVTITAGIDLSAFRDNPVMLYNHDYTKLIGQWGEWRVEGKNLTAAPSFDESDPYAMQQYGKVEAGILRGASIGISPIQFDEVLGEMARCLLLEASLTPVPNNQNALALYNNSGQQLNSNEAGMYLLSLNPTFDGFLTDNRTFDYYALNAPGELELMQRNNPAMFDKLVADKVASVGRNAYMLQGVSESIADKAASVRLHTFANLSYTGKLETYDYYALNAPGELELIQKHNPAMFNEIMANKAAAVRLASPQLFEI